MILQKKNIYLSFFLTLLISSCVTFKELIAVPDSYQGSFISIRDVKQVQLDMSKRAVINILGFPAVNNFFTLGNTWYYISKIDTTNICIQQTVILHFSRQVLNGGKYTIHEISCW